MTARTFPLLAVLSVILSACATLPPAATPASIEFCPGPQIASGEAAYRVAFRATVDETGKVLPATLHEVRDHENSPPEAIVSEARSIAVECRFRPATRDGQPLQAVTEFRIGVRGED